jgi:hypothetical protein
MSHTGMNHRAAVTIPATGAPALKSRPASTKRPNRTKPPAITLMECEMVASPIWALGVSSKIYAKDRSTAGTTAARREFHHQS